MAGWWIFKSLIVILWHFSKPLGAVAYFSHAGWNEDLAIMEFKVLSGPPYLLVEISVICLYGGNTYYQQHTTVYIIYKVFAKSLYVEKHWGSKNL